MNMSEQYKKSCYTTLRTACDKVQKVIGVPVTVSRRDIVIGSTDAFVLDGFSFNVTCDGVSNIVFSSECEDLETAVKHVRFNSKIFEHEIRKIISSHIE